MSTIKSSAEDLTLNADGSGNDIKFQSNGVEKASIDQDGNLVLSGTLTSVGIDDNADATSIVIASSEKVALGGSTAVTSDSQVAIHGGSLELTTAGSKYWIARASDGALTGSLYSPSGSAVRLSGAGTSSGTIEFEPSSSSGVEMSIANDDINFGTFSSGGGSKGINIDDGLCRFRFSNSGTGTQEHLRFYNGNGLVGQIHTSGSSTTYQTSSDYRLKENVVDMENATDRVKQLKPKRFNFIADDSVTVDGFLAHEVSDIVPEAISGEKDGMTSVVLYKEGDEIPEGKSVGDVKTASEPDYQGIDQSKLVPLLVKTIQELEARITALEA